MSVVDKIIWGLIFLAVAGVQFALSPHQSTPFKVRGVFVGGVIFTGIALWIFFKAWRNRQHLGKGPCDLCGRQARPLKVYRVIDKTPDDSIHIVCWICEMQKYLFLLVYAALVVGLGYVIDALKVYFPSGRESIMSPDRYEPYMTVGIIVWLVGCISLYFLVRSMLPAEILRRRASESEIKPYAPESEIFARLQELNAELMAWTHDDGLPKLEQLNLEARKIGRVLHREGGKERMLEVFRALDLGRPIESAWDGIGQWRG